MDVAEKQCLHCGTPVPPGCERFCCTGCERVHELLLNCGLQNFYDLRGSATLAPVPPHALRERDWQWLEDLAARAEAKTQGSGSPQLDLAAQGMSCVGCVWLIESIFNQSSGAQRIEIDATRATARVTWQRGAFHMVDFARRLQRFGYLLGRPDIAPAGEDFSLGRRAGLCAAFALNAMAFSLPSYLGMEKTFVFASWFDLIAACSATLALLVGGSYFAQRSMAALRHGVLHIDTPITLGIAAAWLGSMAGWLGGVEGLKYFDFVAIFIFLMLAGRWLQQVAVERNRRRLLQCTMVPESVTTHDASGKAQTLSLDKIVSGKVLFIKPGEVFPVACVLRSPQATLGLEWINGESDARERREGQQIPSGALNIGASAVEAECLEAWPDSLLHQLAGSKSRGSETGSFFPRLLRGYLAAVIVCGILGFAAWSAAGAGLSKALQVMISVFVVSCPCALGVAAPFADDFAASWMERLGVFVRSSGLWQKLARVRMLVFDKTGTLTMEDPQLVNTEALDALSALEKSALRRLVSGNLHPVSRSLFEALGATVEQTRGEIEEITGQGVRFTDGSGVLWALWKPECPQASVGAGTLKVSQAAEPGSGPVDGASEPRADCIFTRDGAALASFRFQDALRPEMVSAIHALRRNSYDIHLLSGDRSEKVAQIARALSLPRRAWQARMTPAGKAARVGALDPEHTLYIGDGANDSLAFDRALCTGCPVTGRNFLEHKADFYFLGNSLRFIPQLLEAAAQRQRAVRRVFAFALSYNVAAVGVSLAGHMNPLLAAILMPLSSVATLALARLAFHHVRPKQSDSSAPIVGDSRRFRPAQAVQALS